MSSPFHSFDPEEAEPLMETIQIWRWYDARELLLFLDTHILIALLLVGAGIVAAELVRMWREQRNAASPYKLYGTATTSKTKSAKKKE